MTTMGMTITKYTASEYIGYACRMCDGRIAVCRGLETARKLADGGIVRLCVADHCTLPEKRAVFFSTIDQSYSNLSAAVQFADDVGSELIDMPDVNWD